MTDPAFFKTVYDREACEIGMIHIGFGAFHRAHQAVYVDDYMQATGDLRWGIAAVNLRAADSASFAKAAEADEGYLLKSISPDGTLEFRAVRSHLAFVDAAQNLEDALALFARAETCATTITVTESGYTFNEDWSLDLDAPSIQADLSAAHPQTIYGFLALALKRRMETANAPMTIMCCDNIRNNGRVLEGALMTYLSAAGEHDLRRWAEDNVSFPCSMVDRITPRATPALHDEVAGLFPNYRSAPIHAEAFSQWVLQDKFASTIPDLTRSGVQVVTNVVPYEEAKIRILNGGHTGLAYLGALAGHETFDQAIQDPRLRRHYDAWEREEVLPGLGDGIPFDKVKYLSEVSARFENPGIADQLERICMDGYSKMGIYIRPTLEACLAQGITPKAGYDCAASWVVFARRVYAGQLPMAYFEPFEEVLRPMLALGAEERVARDPVLWGDLPTKYAGFVPDLTEAIQQMEQTWQA